VAMVSFADTSVLSRVYAVRMGHRVDPNQEMVGLGAANLAAGLFQGFPISSSSSRTPVAEAAGAKTQVTGIVGAITVALLLLLAPNLLQSLPNAALAAVVIASAIGLFEFAVVMAIIEFLWDGWRPHSAVLGRASGVRGYHDITRYPNARRIPGLVLFRWDAPLFFANAELFKERVSEAAAASPTAVNWVVVAAEPVTSVDVTASDSLAELIADLQGKGITFRFAELKDPVKDKLKRFGLFSELGEVAFYPTVGAAVRDYLATHDVDWKDDDGP
jgi:MFS superfamily sulfate permease-like transporter